MTDTIYALSSGAPPAAIAVIRISGPAAVAALRALGVASARPRRAQLATLRDPQSHEPLDRAITLWFPGPSSATGEDLAELQLHGGRAVVRGVEAALSKIPGLRTARPGEFTRRALDNGRIDLAEAEGLADLLEAETESQRRQALAMAGGALSGVVAAWQTRLLTLSAAVEALLDFSDEDDVAREGHIISNINNEIEDICDEWSDWLSRPHAERLRDGVSVTIAGPPNAGKSTLLNALVERDAAITAAVAGTTRDIIEVPVAINGVPFRIADTAGLHDGSDDVIEAEGMARARRRIVEADLLLWLGPPDKAPDHPHLCRVAARADCRADTPDWAVTVAASDLVLSACSGEGMGALRDWLVAQARTILPAPGEVALHARHRAAIADAHDALRMTDDMADPLIVAEGLRRARLAIDSITGRAGTEAMLDALFGRFCIGK